MDIEISTPALLFPALSLLLLAYTNRFLANAQLIRMLGRQMEETKTKPHNFMMQILNLKKRLELTKWMQFFGVISILFCTFSMFLLFLGFLDFGKKVFGISLVSMCVSMLLSFWEVIISTKALNYELQGYESLKFKKQENKEEK